MPARNGSRDYFPPTSDEWIDLDRLREIIGEVESVGRKEIAPVDLLNRLGIEDDELDLLKVARRIVAASGKGTVLPGAPDPLERGRRKARRDG